VSEDRGRLKSNEGRDLVKEISRLALVKGSEDQGLGKESSSAPLLGEEMALAIKESEDQGLVKERALAIKESADQGLEKVC